MTYIRHTINELLVKLFNYILYIEGKNLKKKGVDLSMNSVHLLEIIQNTKENTMSNIAQTAMITQGTLTTNVKKLVENGVLERYQDSQDKRITRLRLTEKGKQIVAIHDAFHKEMIDRVISDLGLEDDVVLAKSLENLVDYFRKTYEDCDDQ